MRFSQSPKGLIMGLVRLVEMLPERRMVPRRWGVDARRPVSAVVGIDRFYSSTRPIYWSRLPLLSVDSLVQALADQEAT